MKEGFKINPVVASSIMTLAICVAFIYKLHTENETNSRIMRVEGKAECEVNADIADWSMCFEHTGEKRSELSKEIDREKHEVISFLVHNGIPEKDIEFYNYIKEDYNRNRNEYNPRYKMGYCVRVKTKAVELVAKLKNNLFEIFDKDLGIVKNNLRLICSKQDEIELSLYKDAIKNAMSKAQNISQGTGLKLGKVITVENPIFSTESLYHDQNMKRYMDINSVSSVPDTNASQVMQRRRIKGIINITVGLK